MNSKTLIGSALGGLGLFLMGGLVYMVILGDMNLWGQTAEPALPWIIGGEIVFGYLITWVIGVSNASGVQGGAKAAAITGLIIGLAINLIMIGEGHAEIKNGLIDTVVWPVRWGVAGAVVGWWSGRK
ncbi:MAG: hypothetical protein O3C45_07695 [Bacteroidetes bacterium]|nr:hypothetical protein [Bacteroidota bacterium]